MVKKCLLILAIVAVVTGGAFAQDNTVTLDIGPTIVGLTIKSLGDRLGGGDGLSTSGFGIGAQYERQLFEKLSVAGRFSYVGGGIGIKDEDAALAMNLNSFSLEAHARFYPSRRQIFFLDGMLGYANMTASFGGSARVTDEFGQTHTESLSIKASRNYFKLGTKLGWRIDFGTKGGFIFEPSFGYSFVAGLGDTLGEKLVASVNGDLSAAQTFDEAFKYVELFGVGGPRLSLAFGWKF